jgi:hypothetical protein
MDGPLDWRPAVETASIAKHIAAEDFRTALALCGDRSARAVGRYVSDIQLLTFLDLMFECRDPQAKSERKDAERFYEANSDPSAPPPSDDLPSFLSWANEFPEFRSNSLHLSINGMTGPHRGMLVEFDRRIATGCRPRALAKFARSVAVGLSPEHAGDPEFLVFILHGRRVARSRSAAPSE